MDKESFILYNEYREIFEELTDEEAGKLIKSIFEYEETGEVKELNKSLKIAFIPIKQNLDRNSEKWLEIKKKRSEAGKASAEIKKQKATNSTSVNFVENKSTNSTVNVNVNDNVNDNIKENKQRKSFQKPTVEEIMQYCTGRSNNIDAQRFYDFYESKGWKVGKEPMKDWQACVRTWERSTVDKAQRDNVKRVRSSNLPEYYENFYDN